MENPVQVHALANGLKAVLVPCEAESVAFGIFVASGSRHEPAALGGISHFIEHMLFKGTPTRRPIDISRAIEGRGGLFNACTGEQSTCYYAHLPSEYFAEAVDIFSDMYLNALIPDDEFAREKSVVLEELKMYADEPDQVASENLQRALFPGNALGEPIVGTAASLGAMTARTLRRYRATHYVPSRTVAVVAGRFDADAALALLGEKLGRFRAPRGKAPVFGAPVDLSVPPVPEVVAARDVQQTQIALGFRTFGVDHPLKYAATVMNAILGRGMSSRLFQEVREKRALSYDISSHLAFYGDAGVFSVCAGTDPARAGRALAMIERELERISTRAVPARELACAKEFLVGNFRLSHERVTSKMFHYGASMLAFGHPLPAEDEIAAVRAVTAADVRRAAETIFRPELRALSRVVPKTPDGTGFETNNAKETVE